MCWFQKVAGALLRLYCSNIEFLNEVENPTRALKNYFFLYSLFIVHTILFRTSLDVCYVAYQ